MGPEKRRVAVLWLDSGGQPEKERLYADQMAKAREFMLNNKDLRDHPEKGFSVLGADYSEHHASRFRGGEIGWLEQGSNSEAWTKAVTEIAFELQAKGETSKVVTRPEGVFLVRLMDLLPATTRSVEAVRAELARDERTRLRNEVETAFDKGIESRYPVQWPAP